MVGVAGLFEPLRQLLRFGDFALIGQRQRLIDLADQVSSPWRKSFISGLSAALLSSFGGVPCLASCAAARMFCRLCVRVAAESVFSTVL